MSQRSRDVQVVRGLEKRKACDLCHIKKIRCDAKKPTCSHCVVYVAKCVYTPYIRKRRHEVQVQSSTLADEPVAPKPAPLPEPAPHSRTELPPTSELVPHVQNYFANFNSIFPLFDSKTFTAILNGLESPKGPDAVLIAAVNVILALSYEPGSTTLPGYDQATCIENAQSRINHLLAAESHDHLLRIQVLLGLVILRQGTSPAPEGFSMTNSLVASAIKLVHRLGLQQSRTNVQFDAETSLQRQRVFWIAYILDRDTSMRAHDPPLQQENDHDIPIFESTPGYGLMSFTTAAGEEAIFDFFQARIKLAQVQGIIYEQLYSVRAISQPPENRQQTVNRIHGMLVAWFQHHVPVQLLPENLSTEVLALTPSFIRQLITVYFTYLSCYLHIHRVGSHNAEWITRLVNYSQTILFPSSPSPGQSPFTPLLSQESSTSKDVLLVARETAKLFRLVDRTDSSLIWNTGCTYISATLVLIANCLTVSEQGGDLDEEDAKLMEEAMQFFKGLADEMPHFQTLEKACAELECRARIARTRHTSGKWPEPNRGTGTGAAWLETEARKSAGFSAIQLVEAFTTASVKPYQTRLWRAGQ
ncbi:fungal-specific transcription factor domain-containing protein [Podospora australis]|uniref:Fungal-specific transcription factor domain-containing protein n=1 Tax=Podospora australis TaxID=1536484 RepID=A0AAN6WT35_9PEZI|nr:fungal-specific transcription factor domain-containing protein [Podospora australis]